MLKPSLYSPSKFQSFIVTTAIIFSALLLLTGLMSILNNKPHKEQNQLTIYCAHDMVYSEPILKQFEKDTGIKVIVKYDTEATKSLGLTEQLIQERNNPVCDVFWNNEILGTMDLQVRGLLEPFKGQGFARIPDKFKDPDGYWVGFAARLRVWIINTNLTTPTPQAISHYMNQTVLDQVTFAKPLFGTTRTHYTALWHTMGGDQFKQWHHDLLDRKLVIAQSNGQTKNLVAQSHCAIGWTDTDDYFQAKDAGRPVAMLPFRMDHTNQTICIPNTVMIIKNAPNPHLAKIFIDYLVSERIELQLSRSTARQIPLGPVDESKLSDEVKQLKIWAQDGFPLIELQAARQPALDWLKSEYLQ